VAGMGFPGAPARRPNQSLGPGLAATSEPGKADCGIRRPATGLDLG
jgi:hypothetical protein